jgi:chromosome segregation ATPase
MTGRRAKAMKKSSKKISAALAMVFFFSFCVRAEQITVKEEATPKPSTITAKQEISVKILKGETDAEAAARYEKMKAEIAALKEKINALGTSVEEMKTEINKIEESNLEVKTISEDLEVYKSRINIFEEKYKKDKDKVDQSLEEFESMKSDLKGKLDKMQGWNDVLEVMKKELNNMELEIAKLKKNINDLKNTYGEDDNMLNTVAKWPYLALTAVVLSVTAVIIAASK